MTEPKKLIRYHEAPELVAHERAIATKEARLGVLCSEQENAEAALTSARASAADVAALVSIGRRPAKDLDAAKARAAELEERRSKARGEELTLTEELARDRQGLETLRIEAARTAAVNLRDRAEELCEELEPLLERVQALNSELETVTRECRSQFPANGPGSEFRKTAGVPTENGLTVPLACHHAFPGAVVAWKERWRDALAACDRASARFREAMVASKVA